MKLKLIAIRDRQLDAYMQPFAMQSLGQAIRGFRDEINNPQSELYKHPEDYDLYHLADFNQEDGIIKVLDRPTQIAIGSNLRETK